MQQARAVETPELAEIHIFHVLVLEVPCAVVGSLPLTNNSPSSINQTIWICILCAKHITWLLMSAL